MFISIAQAQEVATDTAIIVGEAAPAATPAGSFLSGVLPIVVMVVLFYILLIRPQQKRFAAHKVMLDGLKVGDAVVTGGGLVGKIDKIVNDDEVVIDLGEMKVTALRSTIQIKAEKTAVDKKKTK